MWLAGLMLSVFQFYHRIFVTILGMKPRKIPLTMLCLTLAAPLEGGRIQVQQPKVRKPEIFSFVPIDWKIQEES